MTHNGRIVVLRHAMLIPLLNTQGHVKAVVVLMNRSHCSCERMERLAEMADDQCTCSPSIRALKRPFLAVDAWSAAAAPCETCSRKLERELSYGEFISAPPSSLDIDSSSHFIRQAAPWDSRPERLLEPPLPIRRCLFFKQPPPKPGLNECLLDTRCSYVNEFLELLQKKINRAICLIRKCRMCDAGFMRC